MIVRNEGNVLTVVFERDGLVSFADLLKIVSAAVEAAESIEWATDLEALLMIEINNNLARVCNIVTALSSEGRK